MAFNSDSTFNSSLNECHKVAFVALDKASFKQIPNPIVRFIIFYFVFVVVSIQVSKFESNLNFIVINLTFDKHST